MKKISLNRIKRGALRNLVLSVLAEKPMYAYEIIKNISSQTHGFYKPSTGSVYPVLKSLINEGLVEVFDYNGKKMYKLTEKGIEEYEKIRKNREDFFSPTSPVRKEIIDILFEIGYTIYVNKDRISNDKLLNISKLLHECKNQVIKLLEES